MKTIQLSLVLMAPLTLFILGSGVAHAQANDMFPSKVAAEKRAKELKCSGAFSMGDAWMPCKDFDSYEKALKSK